MSKEDKVKGLIPIFGIVGVVGFPLIFILGVVLGSLFGESNSLTSDSISSWVSAIATVAIAVLTFILAKETWELRRTQTEQIRQLRRESIRPNVAVALRHSDLGMNFIEIHITNLGHGVAKNVKFSFYDQDGVEVVDSDEGIIKEFLKLHVLKSGIHALGIGQSINSFLFSFYDIDGNQKDIFSHYLRLKVTFEDIESYKYENEFVMDFQEFQGISELGGGNPLHQLAKDFKSFKEIFDQVTKGSKRVQVDSYNTADRVEKAQKDKEWLKRAKRERGVD
ncbi:TPA: hypothetical protein ACVO1K_004496 [Vibrio diabolicus]